MVRCFNDINSDTTKEYIDSKTLIKLKKIENPPPTSSKYNLMNMIKEGAEHRYDSWRDGYKFYRIIIDEADSVNLRGSNNISMFSHKYIKLGLVTSTYDNLYGYGSLPIFSDVILRNSNGNEKMIPIIKNKEEYIKKSFAMPEINKSYLICTYNNKYSDIMNGLDYLVNKGLMPHDVRELLNVNDFHGAMKKMGVSEENNENIIDKICKNIIVDIKNKKIEREMILKLDLTEHMKNEKISNIDKHIAHLNERVKDLNMKFRDINIYDKARNKYGVDAVNSIEDIFVDYDGIPDCTLSKVEIEEKHDKEKKELSELFKKINVSYESNADDLNIFNKLLEQISNDNKYCGICSGFYKNPVLLNCSHIYCSVCLFGMAESKKNLSCIICPVCKQSSKFNKLRLLVDESSKNLNVNDEFELKEDYKALNLLFKEVLNSNNTTESFVKTKTIRAMDNTRAYDTLDDKLMSIIKLLKYIHCNNSKKKVLVFSNHESIIENIITRVNNHDLSYKYEHAKGVGAEKSITRFKTGNSNLLFLNSKHNASGIEIVEGTDIIILHKMTNSVEKQIIGRCMRMGRIQPINVYYLYHMDEIEPQPQPQPQQYIPPVAVPPNLPQLPLL